MSNIINISIKELRDLFKQKVDSASFFDPRTCQIIDACSRSLEKGIHPAFVIQSSALEELAQSTGFNFYSYNCDDALSSFTPVDNRSKLQITLEQVPNVSCKHYSFFDNLSYDYPYANNVLHPTCSNESLNSSTCLFPSSQYNCPLYNPDQSLFTKHIYSADENGLEYSYTSYITRQIDGTMLIHIFDSQDNLIQELSYSLSSFKDIQISDLKEEITKIVTYVYENSFMKENSDVDLIDDFNEKSSDSSVSYVLSLIN
jgi:hypothetical protein